MTRKIKSLKENECILISTKRDARIIKRKTGSLHSAKEMKGIYYYKHKGINCISVNPLAIILPASDFINPRLKDKVKAISKRLDALELSNVSTIKDNNAIINGMPVTYTDVKEYSASEPYNRDAVAQAKSEEEAADILVKDAEEVKPGLEVGKWYKRASDGAMFQFNGEFDKDKDPCGIGFLPDGKYMKSGSGWGLPFGKWYEATHEEVSAALIEEAKRRYKVGDIVKSIVDGGIFGNVRIEGDFIYEFGSIHCNNVTLFKDGQWTEIVEQPKDIDWSVPGQLVESSLGNIAITSGQSSSTKFSGTIIQSTCNNLGSHTNGLIKREFKPYTGQPIILSNAKD